MAEHEAVARKRYYNVSCGWFIRKVDGVEKNFAMLDGDFSALDIIDDPGNKENQIKASKKVIVTLVDAGENYEIKCSLGTTFSWMLASHLKDISLGDRLQIRTWPGSDNQKVSICMIDRVNCETGVVEKVTRTAYEFEDDLDKHHAAKEDIIHH